MNALIVDDEPDRRQWMREGLLDHGVACVEACTVREAIERLVCSSYDLVVCDMVLNDPPEASNAAFRGYLVVCFALARPNGVVVQASTLRTCVHTGAILTNWTVEEVADVLYGSRGIPQDLSVNGGCPWSALERAAAASPDRRAAAAAELARLPIVRELEGPLGMDGSLARLEDAASGRADWATAVADLRRILFPGADRAA